MQDSTLLVCDENSSYEVLANSFEELLSHDAQQLIAGDYQFNPEYEEIMLQTPKNILEWEMPDWLARLA
ncbi:hypothetical protein QYC30_12880 [Thermosynechococcus sp. JY1339]|uniref:hypothetical protein n=1 Tax=Thermosynechococcus sp. JY1339 TaxID=3058431 RepID=UPI002673F9F4|nr:hypothetical protein [Thermosynechococcus sp. JY1339]WKT86314.1 hypothetical protein QYC30_12880 [Thermosynechococcus sp. JY1339]